MSESSLTAHEIHFYIQIQLKQQAVESGRKQTAQNGFNKPGSQPSSSQTCLLQTEVSSQSNQDSLNRTILGFIKHTFSYFFGFFPPNPKSTSIKLYVQRRRVPFHGSQPLRSPPRAVGAYSADKTQETSADLRILRGRPYPRIHCVGSK